MAATVERSNSKTTKAEAQLVGNTLVLNAANHQVYVLGKSVMLNCANISDIVPNNNTKLLDIQFNGNLYKGVEELMIIKQNNKSDKVMLEEGSVIITGLSTIEQLNKAKGIVAAGAKNLAELKYNMALEDNVLGLSK